MSRLYVVESCYTITGAMADHRLALRSEQIADFVAPIDPTTLKADEVPRPQAGDHPAATIHSGLESTIFVRTAGSCAFVAGLRQPPDVQEGTLHLNASFGKFGETFVDQIKAMKTISMVAELGAIEALASNIDAGA